MKPPSSTQSPSLAAPRMSSRKLKLNINTQTWIEREACLFKLRNLTVKQNCDNLL
ncbi:hypothetical protein HanRHA438_Chr10g0432961 [Helianthus annuus]|nr:hypothetical protein HanRHA438_Chr10g0432961 [Helianthus annuus]